MVRRIAECGRVLASTRGCNPWSGTSRSPPSNSESQLPSRARMAQPDKGQVAWRGEQLRSGVVADALAERSTSWRRFQRELVGRYR